MSPASDDALDCLRDAPLPFYHRPDRERIALTEAAIFGRRTLIAERWAPLADAEATPWSGRSALAAEWLEGASGVLDLGCGMMGLEDFLQAGTKYWPSDVVARDARTLVYDYNDELPPKVDADAVACLGLLEYLHDPEALLRELAPYRLAVISYCVTDAPAALEPRRAHGWVNDLDTAAIEAMFDRTGWAIDRSTAIGGVQRIWRLTH